MQAAQVLSSNRLRYAQAGTKVERAKGVVVTYLILLILLAFTCSLFYIWSRIQIVNVGYEINREASVKEKLIEENKRLSLEVATLRSPVRLEALAKNEYHMDLPQKSQVLSDTQVKILEITPAGPGKKVASSSVPFLKKQVTPKPLSTEAAKISSEKNRPAVNGKDLTQNKIGRPQEKKVMAKILSPTVKPPKVATAAGDRSHH